jgi:hypothetical protein
MAAAVFDFTRDTYLCRCGSTDTFLRPIDGAGMVRFCGACGWSLKPVEFAAEGETG